jgi:hypothetical protein
MGGPVRQPSPLSPLPLVAAGVSASCIAVGGILPAGVSGMILLDSMPLPGADILRFSNGLGFAMVGIGGTSATALSIVCLGVQARKWALWKALVSL